MRSLILNKVARGILPVTSMFALYLLLRGHNEPGGGFIAGLVTAAALVLQGLAFGVQKTSDRLVPLIRPAAPLGLAVALGSMLAGPMMGEPLGTHFHAYVSVLGMDPLHVSTTLAFDIGVYLVVLGASATALATFSTPLPPEGER
jgi:multicomponent Na+:H+ antiporter subunit B